jgi:phospholipase C
MKLAAVVLPALFLFGAAAALSQEPNLNGKIKHVIVVIQENRTPDNIFGSNVNFEAYVNLTNTGLNGSVTGGTTTLTVAPLETCYDLGHKYEDFQDMWHNGAMDGAWDVGVYPPSGCTALSNPQYKFADPNEVKPYFDIATQFGFANYMFQTNQGPSFPAHQFLFSGTSAPVSDDGYYQYWFASGNPVLPASPAGCLGPTTNLVPQVTNLGTYPYSEVGGWTPDELSPTPPATYPCYRHNSIATVLDAASPKISWRYYTNDHTSLWTAPNALEDICEPSGNTAGGICTGSDFVNDVVEERVQTVKAHPAIILEDIQNCHLQQVSFVTPDGAWSDHSGAQNPVDYGPSWVAAIVNGIGQGINGKTCGYWANTVILITWDDWGGWYDHVNPDPIHLGYSDGSGYNYVYGFRVPLLVVSAYSPPQPPGQGYVSGAWTGGLQPTSCTTPQYCHDFGSILNFIEFVFGKGGVPLGPISVSPAYADSLAQDATCGSACPYALSDFFNFSQAASGFTQISAPHDANFFLNYTGQSQPPDND